MLGFKYRMSFLKFPFVFVKYSIITIKYHVQKQWSVCKEKEKEKIKITNRISGFKK